MKKLWEVVSKPVVKEEGEGYPANRDPKMLAAEPGAEARFVAKHVSADPKKVTDVDDSTHDDKLFKADNIKRAVPSPNGDTHGHTPVGKDAAVYEAVALAMAGRVFAQGAAAVSRGVQAAGRSRVTQAVVQGARHRAARSLRADDFDRKYKEKEEVLLSPGDDAEKLIQLKNIDSRKDNYDTESNAALAKDFVARKASRAGKAVARTAKDAVKNSVAYGLRDQAGAVGNAIADRMQGISPAERSRMMMIAAARERMSGQNTMDVRADNNIQSQREQMARARGIKQ